MSLGGCSTVEFLEYIPTTASEEQYDRTSLSFSGSVKLHADISCTGVYKTFGMRQSKHTCEVTVSLTGPSAKQFGYGDNYLSIWDRGNNRILLKMEDLSVTEEKTDALLSKKLTAELELSRWPKTLRLDLSPIQIGESSHRVPRLIFESRMNYATLPF